MEDWLSSDWHIGHRNVIKYDKRPFANIDEMKESILDNFFSVVKKGDRFFYHRDMSLNGTILKEIIDKIKREGIVLIFIKGNHDNIPQNIKHHLYYDTNINGQSIFMCHYPMLTWSKSHYGSWMTFGHHHSDYIYSKTQGKMMNVGITLNDYKPFHWDQVVEFMSKQPDNWDTIRR